MSGGIVTISPSGNEEATPPPTRQASGRKLLLISGIVSSLLYAGMLVFIPLRWEVSSSASQTVRELSAIDAPTRSLSVPLGIVWTLLYAAFGSGVWKAAGSGREHGYDVV